MCWYDLAVSIEPSGIVSLSSVAVLKIIIYLLLKEAVDLVCASVPTFCNKFNKDDYKGRAKRAARIRVCERSEQLE